MITRPRRLPKPELKLGKGWNEDDQGSFVSEVSSRQAQRAKLEILGQRSQTEKKKKGDRSKEGNLEDNMTCLL